ncbi:MAG TPA: CocE/NonD family hydrolase [Alphaproteobacteria bacterium]|nr:CocE/NonD family hydrolase [Alphaproteobacteria bacterium]
MKIVDRFPRAVREIETEWIELADGCRLAARLWLPEDADRRPVPAILEFLPYRRRDGTIIRDSQTHHYLAGHGYACARVDIRGTGDSDGVLIDEYLPQEQADAVEVIAWLARQPWCSGAVGMMGISWGGFNSLQVAAHRPPALKAIVTLCSTDDRYRDDCHYMGGCLLNNNFSWASTLFAYGAQPPDPEVVGERWRRMWRERLEHIVPPLITWLEHPHRDAYWRQGSIAEDYGAITAAVYAVGGWADGYSNAIPRLMKNLTCPRKALIGPWAHDYPHFAEPGPAIGFLQEALRWWDHWLKGEDSGIMTEPMIRIWMQEAVRPASTYTLRPGRWLAEEGWPPAGVAPRRLRLSAGRLSDEPGPAAWLALASPQTTGTASGEWCPYGMPGELAVDQRGDDGRSLCFDSTPLPDRLEILGAPVATLEIAVDQPVAQIGVRLCEIWPDGASTLITYGVLNLAHREGHERPQPTIPGQPTRIAVQLNDIAHAFAPGNRIRLAVSSALWPMVWPAPEPVSLKLDTGGSSLDLPVRPAGAEAKTLPAFAEPEAAPQIATENLLHRGRNRVIVEDPSTGLTRVKIRRVHREFRLPHIDLGVRRQGDEQFLIHAEDPSRAGAQSEGLWSLERDGWKARTQTRLEMQPDGEAFTVIAELNAFEGEEPFFARRWERRIPRKLL